MDDPVRRETFVTRSSLVDLKAKAKWFTGKIDKHEDKQKERSLYWWKEEENAITTKINYTTNKRKSSIFGLPTSQRNNKI